MRSVLSRFERYLDLQKLPPDILTSLENVTQGGLLILLHHIYIKIKDKQRI